MTIPARTVLAVVGRHGHRAELDAFRCPPRLFVTFEEFDAVKPDLGKGLQEVVLLQSARDAPAPEFWVVLEM